MHEFSIFGASVAIFVICWYFAYLAFLGIDLFSSFWIEDPSKKAAIIALFLTLAILSYVISDHKTESNTSAGESYSCTCEYECCNKGD